MYQDQVHKDRAKEIIQTLGDKALVPQESLDEMKRNIDKVKK